MDGSETKPAQVRGKESGDEPKRVRRKAWNYPHDAHELTFSHFRRSPMLKNPKIASLTFFMSLRFLGVPPLLRKTRNSEGAVVKTTEPLNLEPTASSVCFRAES